MGLSGGSIPTLRLGVWRTGGGIAYSRVRLLFKGFLRECRKSSRVRGGVEAASR